MILTKPFMGFNPGQPVEQVEVLESPPGKTRVQVIGSDDTVVQFWCPSNILTRDLDVADELDAELEAAQTAAENLLAERPTTREGVVAVIRAAYSPIFKSYDQRIHDETRLRRKWRAAWSQQRARGDGLERRLNELASPDGVQDLSDRARGRVSSFMRLIRELRTAEMDREHENA